MCWLVHNLGLQLLQVVFLFWDLCDEVLIPPNIYFRSFWFVFKSGHSYPHFLKNLRDDFRVNLDQAGRDMWQWISWRFDDLKSFSSKPFRIQWCFTRSDPGGNFHSWKSKQAEVLFNDHTCNSKDFSILDWNQSVVVPHSWWERSMGFKGWNFLCTPGTSFVKEDGKMDRTEGGCETLGP